MTDFSAISDFELIHLLKSDSEEAYTEIYNRYFNVLYLHVLKRVNDKEAAGDLIQDLFTSVWNKRKNIHILTNPSNYFYTAARNAVFNYISRQKLASDYIKALPDLETVGECITDYLVREKQFSAIIEKEVNELPEKMRLIFQMSRVQHLSHKQIAEKLGLSELTVKTQVKNALRLLRNKLGLLLYILMILKSK